MKLGKKIGAILISASLLANVVSVLDIDDIEAQAASKTVKNGWSNGKFYKDGKLYTGTRKGKYIKKGNFANGYIKLKNKTYYFFDGNKLTGYAERLHEIAISQSGIIGRYFFVNGQKYTGNFEGKYYQKGVLADGYYRIGKTTFHFNKGEKTNGYISIDGEPLYFLYGKSFTGVTPEYRLVDDSIIKTNDGLYDIGDSTYLLIDGRVIRDRLIKYGEYYYKANKKGELYKNCTFDIFEFNSKGQGKIKEN